MAPPPVAILLVSGSPSAESANTALLRTAQAMTPEGVMTLLYDELGELPAFEEGTEPPPAPERLRGLLVECHAILFSTPQHDGGLPGQLQNLLDWTAATGALEKPVAWVDASAPPAGAEEAHARLREALQDAGADVVVGACARIPVTAGGVGKDGLVADARVRSSAGWVLSSLAEHVRAQRRAQAERERLGHG
jgi:NAD(P)H-dependent FMN reductase